MTEKITQKCPKTDMKANKSIEFSGSCAMKDGLKYFRKEDKQNELKVKLFGVYQLCCRWGCRTAGLHHMHICPWITSHAHVMLECMLCYFAAKVKKFPSISNCKSQALKKTHKH